MMDEQTTGLNETASAADEWPPLFIGEDGLEVDSKAPTTGSEVDVSGESETPEPAPTTGSTENAGESNPQTGTEQEPQNHAEPVEEPATPRKRTLSLKVDHEAREFDVDGTPDEELAKIIQKGLNFDRMMERQKAAQDDYKNAEKYRAFVQEKARQFLDDGDSVDRAKAMAGQLASMDGLKAYPVSLSEDGTVTLAGDYANGVTVPDEPEPAAPEPAPTPQAAVNAGLEVELRQLRAMYPSMTEIPADVLKLHTENGIPLATAMLHAENRRIQARAAELEKENRTLRQNADAAARAPVRGVSGGNVPMPDKQEDDPFLKAFWKGNIPR